MSHKGSYGGKSHAGRKIPTSVERTLGKALNAVLDFGIAMYEEGKKAGAGKTTTSSSSGVSPVTTIGHGASRKPSARNK